jgi:NAD(P)H dehydrogenase (quinone)
VDCLILYAHPNPASFNHAVLDTVEKALTQLGHDVVARDLYALKFDPVLKGYIDRVFSYGFAYSMDNETHTIKGLLAGKKAVIFNTTGGDEAAYTQNGLVEALAKTIDNGIFAFCGIKVEAHKFMFAVPTTTLEQRQAMLAEIPEVLEEALFHGWPREK